MLNFGFRPEQRGVWLNGFMGSNLMRRSGRDVSRPYIYILDLHIDVSGPC